MRNREKNFLSRVKIWGKENENSMEYDFFFFRYMSFIFSLLFLL